MKDKIHPKYYPKAKVVCACGNTFEVGSTRPEMHTDICSACHPFFTGEMRIVDTAGQVERFIKRLERRDSMLPEQQPVAVAEMEAPAEAKTKGRGKKKIVYELVDEDKPAAAPASDEGATPEPE
jgi:large subunit ribosomal protein L31